MLSVQECYRKISRTSNAVMVMMTTDAGHLSTAKTLLVAQTFPAKCGNCFSTPKTNHLANMDYNSVA